jgi:hypothetical protein
VRPFHVNEAMSMRVHQEFHALAEEEERLGIPVTFSIDCEDEMMCTQVGRGVGRREITWC